MSEAHAVVFAHTGAHAHRRGCHRAPLFHRGRHRAPVTFPIPLAQQGRYALVVGAAVIGAGVVALGSAAALPGGADVPGTAIAAVDRQAEYTASIPRYAPEFAPPPARSRNAPKSTRPDSPITEQPAEKQWRTPLDSYDLTSTFGARWGLRHEGLDFAAAPGTPVYAAYDGVVKSSGWNYGGFGKLVVIDHGDGVETYYAHNSELTVSAGQRVRAGDQIAAVGNTGNSLGPHSHFEVHLDGEPIDPLPFLTERGVDVIGRADSVESNDGPLH